MTMKPIQIWPFNQAPKRYQKLSQHGGDEDWIAFIPHATYKKIGQPGWMYSGSNFGCCDVSEHVHKDGMIFIGAHA